LLEQPRVLGAAQQLPGAGRRAAMTRDAPAGGGDDLQLQLAEPGRDGDGLPDQAGRDAVAVALERDQRRTADDALDRQLRGERERGQRDQALLGGELRDRLPVARASVSDRGRPRECPTFCVSGRAQ
jgi:hypothetical protein